MWTENILISHHSDSGEYLIDEKNQQINISHSLWKSYGISDVEICFPSTELTEDETVQLESYKNNWYMILWETDKNWEIPNKLQQLLESPHVQEYEIIIREKPNKNIVVWKINFENKKTSIMDRVKKWISSLL